MNRGCLRAWMHVLDKLMPHSGTWPSTAPTTNVCLDPETPPVGPFRYEAKASMAVKLLKDIAREQVRAAPSSSTHPETSQAVESKP
jgi:hypothetical protein